jgi:hypothetical protein
MRMKLQSRACKRDFRPFSNNFDIFYSPENLLYLPRVLMLAICQIKRSRDFTCAIFGILACHDQIKKVSASSIHTRGDMPPNSLPPNTTVCSSHYVRLPNVFPILYNRSRCFVLSNILFLILPIVSNLA